MKGFSYRGDYTVSIDGNDGERFLTVMADGRVVLPRGRSEGSVVRVYADLQAGGNGTAVLTSLPMTLRGKENAYKIGIEFAGDTGQGVIGKEIFYFRFDRRWENVGSKSAVFTTRFQMDADRSLCSKAGRSRPEDLFHSEPNRSFFPCNPWRITPVR